jgi:uncharacterized protein (TIGR03437 family)
LVWHGVGFTNGVSIPSAVITVEIRLPTGSRTASFTFRAQSLTGSEIRHVLFPVIAGISALGSGADNTLLLPEFGGRLLPDPVHKLSGFGMQYPGPLSMQMMAFYNAQAGLFVASHDLTGQAKEFQWFTSATTPQTATIRIDHVFPSEPVDALSLPYECVIGTFQGDWTAAADLYKGWTAGTPWIAGASSRKSPAWLADLQYGRQQCMNHCGDPKWDTTYQAVLQEQSHNVALLGSPAVLRFMGWEKLGSWYYGDYFPPQGGWTAFDQFVASLHQQKNYLEVVPSMKFLDTETPMWATPEAQSAASLDRGGKVETYYMAPNNTPHTWAFMNPASKFWQQNMVTAISTLAAHNVDMVQLDNWTIGSLPDDYSAGHPPGYGGTWQTAALSTILAGMRAAIAAQNSQMALSSEEISEVFMPYLDLYLNRDQQAELMGLEYTGVTPVPLFPYVYKPYVLAKTDYWPTAAANESTSYHFLAYARALVWGQIPAFVPAPWLEDTTLPAAVLSYFKSVGKALTAYSRFLERGTMLPPPQIASPTTAVVLDSSDVTPWSGTADSIQSNAWRAAGGEVGVVLTNIGSGAVALPLPIDFARWGLISGLNYTVALDTGAGPAPFGSKVAGTASLAITVQPQQIVVVTLQPPSLTANAAVNAASYGSNSPIAPSELLTVFGSNLAGSPSGASSTPLPAMLGGLSATVEDSNNQVNPCSMVFVSNGQVNFAIPDNIATGPAVITVSATDGRAATLKVQVSPVAPGIFSANGDGQGAPAGTVVLVAANGTQSVSPLYSCGAAAGSCVPAEIDFSNAAQAVAVLYGTGIRHRSSLSAVSVSVGAVSVPAVYAGAQGQYTGLDQINFQLPASLRGQGSVDLAVIVDGQRSNALKLRFK